MASTSTNTSCPSFMGIDCSIREHAGPSVTGPCRCADGENNGLFNIIYIMSKSAQYCSSISVGNIGQRLRDCWRRESHTPHTPSCSQLCGRQRCLRHRPVVATKVMFGEIYFGYVWLRTEVMGDLKENASWYLLFSPSCSRYLWPGTGQLLLAGPFYVRELAKMLRGYF